VFYGASSFNQPLTSFDTSAVTDMGYMFYGASSFNQPLTSFNTSAVTNMNAVFFHASSFNQSLTSFDTSAVTDMEAMFYGASSFNQPLTSFNTCSVTTMRYMFDGANALSACNKATIASILSASFAWPYSGSSTWSQDTSVCPPSPAPHAPPPAPLSCGPGTVLNTATNRCEIACDHSGRPRTARVARCSPSGIACCC